MQCQANFDNDCKDLITLEVQLVCSDINDRYDIRQASLPRSLRFVALKVIWGSLVSAIVYF